MTDWLSICREAAGDVKAVLVDLPGRAEREPVVAQGEGGDDTTAIDAAAERVILKRFEGLDVTIVSEEVGEYGNGRWRVVVDPIDGSLNAKRGIPFFSLSIAVADGKTMDDVVFGYVYDFGTGEEWTATRGGGAFLNGERLGAQRPKDKIEILSFESTLTSEVADKAAAFTGIATRLRIMGSLALSLCELAAGRVDGVCSLKPARSVDVAAGQLLVRECGLAIENVDGGSFSEAPLDLVGRSRIAAAGTDELCRVLANALSARREGRVVDEATSGNVSVRGARADEGPRLKDVAIAAKCHWGYPVDRVHEWADHGDFSPRGIEALEPFVVEADGRIVGWASVVAHGEVAWLEDLWVEPAWMRGGVGTTLFRHALERARVMGARRLEWEAEPNALGFYEKLGAARVRDSEPTAFGRVVPVMGVDVDV